MSRHQQMQILGAVVPAPASDTDSGAWSTQTFDDGNGGTYKNDGYLNDGTVTVYSGVAIVVFYDQYGSVFVPTQTTLTFVSDLSGSPSEISVQVDSGTSYTFTRIASARYKRTGNIGSLPTSGTHRLTVR